MLASSVISLKDMVDTIKAKSVVYILVAGIFWLLVAVAYIDNSKLYRTVIALLVYLPTIALCFRNYKCILIYFMENKPLFLLLLLLFLYAFINAIINGGFKEVRHIIYIQIFLLSGVLLSSVTIKDRLTIYLWRCAYLLVLGLSLYSIYSFFVVDNNPITKRMWGNLGISHPIIGSYYIAFFALFSLFLVVEDKKHYYSIGFTIFLCFILFAQSRGAYLAFFLALCTYFILSIHKNKSAIFILLISIFACSVLAYLFIEQIEDRGASRRPELWVSGIKMGLEKFWFGHGINYKYGVFVENTPKYLIDGFEHSHNLLIHIFIQLGFIGALLFGVLWGYCLYLSFKYRKFFLAKFIFIYMVFCTIAFQFDAASFIDTPRLEWMVVWLPIWLIIYFLGVYPEKVKLGLALKEKNYA